MVISFFFSSRRRHTISTRDWSSDVCSSDLVEGGIDERQCVQIAADQEGTAGGQIVGELDGGGTQVVGRPVGDHVVPGDVPVVPGVAPEAAAEVDEPGRPAEQRYQPGQRPVLGPLLVVTAVPVCAVVVVVGVVVRDLLHPGPLPSVLIAG